LSKKIYIYIFDPSAKESEVNFLKSNFEACDINELKVAHCVYISESMHLYTVVCTHPAIISHDDDDYEAKPIRLTCH
jgi:hypothetical protein